MPENDNNAQARGPDYLSEIIKAIGGSSPPRDAPTNPSSSEKSETPNVGGDILSSLLSNPELMTKLPSIIAAIKPIMEMMGAQSAQKTDTVPTSAPISAPIKLPPPPQKGGGDSRTALLCAMKPYLSAERSQAIDYIVKLGRLGDILKTL